MATKAKQTSAEELIKSLVDMHELEGRIGKKGGASYEDVRKLRREGAALWATAHAHVYGPPKVDNKPKNAAEAARWKRNEQRVAAGRETGVTQNAADQEATA